MPPAARATDMHVCPMVTVLVPHVGGPILPPCEPTVLIGFLPAARVTDMLTCVGPPDIIVMGSPTVLIGGLMAARIGDPTAHGGAIILGCFTVMIGEAGVPSPPAPPSPSPPSADAAALTPEAEASPVSEGSGGSAGPQTDKPFFHQEKPMSCVLASSRMIIKQLTGKDPGEKTLRDEAQKAGWYDPKNGSNPWQIPSLLANHGVTGARAQKNMSLDDLATATSTGKPVMVGLRNPGHRIVVDGVKTNADGSKTVLIRDPAYDGSSGYREVPSADFQKRYNPDSPVIRFD